MPGHPCEGVDAHEHRRARHLRRQRACGRRCCWLDLRTTQALRKLVRIQTNPWNEHYYCTYCKSYRMSSFWSAPNSLVRRWEVPATEAGGDAVGVGAVHGTFDPVAASLHAGSCGYLYPSGDGSHLGDSEDNAVDLHKRHCVLLHIGVRSAAPKDRRPSHAPTLCCLSQFKGSACGGAVLCCR